jgi:single-strand DNA-binding protein
MNSVFLVGNLGKAPEVKESNDTTYAHLSVATTERFERRDGKTAERTDWHRVVAFNGLAETLRQLDEGDKVAIEGKLRTNSSTTKDGERRTSIEVHASRIEVLSRARERE